MSGGLYFLLLRIHVLAATPPACTLDCAASHSSHLLLYIFTLPLQTWQHRGGHAPMLRQPKATKTLG